MTKWQNLTWDAVSTKIAALIEQGRLIVPIKETPAQPQVEQLALTPEESEKLGLPEQEQQLATIEVQARLNQWEEPTADTTGECFQVPDEKQGQLPHSAADSRSRTGFAES